MVEINKKLVRGRAYPWGNLSVDNDAHCDLNKLREMLLFVNTIDLVELTHVKNYHAYRTKRLLEMGFTVDDDKDSEITVVLAAKRQQAQEYAQHAEQEIKDAFVSKVRSKEAEIRVLEDDLNAKYSSWKSEILARTERLAAAKRELDAQQAEFNARKFTLASSKSATLNNTITSGKHKKK